MKNMEIKIESLDTSKVIVTFANQDYFKGMLDIIAHRFTLDLLIVYKQIINNDEDGLTTRTILKTELEEAGLTIELLDEIAKRNTAKLFPAILSDFFGMTIITNSISSCGAAAILYSDLVKEYAERLQSDVYLIPSSIHEVILLPARDFIDEDFTEIIKAVNKAIVEPKEVLSDHAYIYERRSGVIRIA